jgi:predicted transcriptional regulator
MDKRTKGAWLIHHSNKLSIIKTSSGEYEQIDFAGKCGMLLNALAGSDEITMDIQRVNALGKAAGISTRLELPTILKELERQNLIDQGKSGITVLGLTTGKTLQHAATIYENANPTTSEEASLEIAEIASDWPTPAKEAQEYVSDSLHIPTAESKDLITQFTDIGFLDSEEIGDDRVLFNGNLFRRNEIRKISGVLSSLSSHEEAKVRELFSNLDSAGCINKERAIAIVGDSLFNKLASIGFVDINTIGNEQGTYSFVTRPAAFNKFSNALLEDAFDLAKAFVTSLTYGITRSSSRRGRIKMFEALMRKLLTGAWVGPATAIGQDYKILELKGVIQLRPANGNMFFMKLLKKDIGAIAYKVISEGEAATTTMEQFPQVSATKFAGPEDNRSVIRKRQSQPLKRGIATILNDLRTGVIK